MIKLVKNEFFIYSKETRIESNRSFYGSFRIGPFDAGQSITIANALRRTLLSELKGLAITSAEIEGAFHEYSALPGVKDSVLDILLNLKDIVLKSVNYGNKKKGTSYAATFSQAKLDQIGYLKTRGPGIVTASELKLPPGIQCVDPDQYIATLSEEGSLNIKFTINEGKNYIVPSSPHTKNDLRKAPSDEDEREHSLSTLFMEGKGPVSPLSPKQSKQSPLFSRSEEKGALKKRSKVKVVLSGHMNAIHMTQSAKQSPSIKKGDKKSDKKSDKKIDKKSDKGALSSQVQRGEGSPKERGKGVPVLPHKVKERVSKKRVSKERVSKGRGKGASKEEGNESRESLVGAASFFTRGAGSYDLPGHMNAKQPFQIKRGGVGRFKIGRSSFGESSRPILNLNLKKGPSFHFVNPTRMAHFVSEAAPSPSPFPSLREGKGEGEERSVAKGAGSYLASLLKESGHMNRWTEGRGAVKKKRLWLYKIRLASFSTREQGTFLSIKNRDDRLYKIPSHFKTSRRSFSPFSLSLETLPLPFNQNNKSASVAAIERRASQSILKKSNLIKKATKGAGGSYDPALLLKFKKESEVGNLGPMNRSLPPLVAKGVAKGVVKGVAKGVVKGVAKGEKVEAPLVQNRPYFLLAFALSKREVRRSSPSMGCFAARREGAALTEGRGPSLLKERRKGSLFSPSAHEVRSYDRAGGEREERSEFLQRDPKNKEASLLASHKLRSQGRGKRTFLNIKEGLSFHKQKKDLLLPSSISPRSIKLSEKREEGLMASKAVPLAIDAVFMPVNKVNYIIERNAAELMIKNAFSNSKSGSETAGKRSRLRDSFFSYGEKRVSEAAPRWAAPSLAPIEAPPSHPSPLGEGKAASSPLGTAAREALATHLDQKRIATLGSYDPLFFRRENQAPLKNTFYKSSLGEPFPYYKAGSLNEQKKNLRDSERSSLKEREASKSTTRSLRSHSEEEEKSSNFKRALSKDLRSRGVGTALPSEPALPSEAAPSLRSLREGSYEREARRVARRVARTSMFFFKSAAARNVHHLIGTQAFLLKEKRAPLASLLRESGSLRTVADRTPPRRRETSASLLTSRRRPPLRATSSPLAASLLAKQPSDEPASFYNSKKGEKQSRGKNSNIANVPQYYVCNPYKNTEKRIQGDNQRITPLKNNIVFEIWTNGSIHPRQALYEACKNLLSLFSQLENATPLAFPPANIF